MVMEFTEPMVSNLKVTFTVKFADAVFHRTRGHHGIFPSDIEGQVFIESNTGIDHEYPVAGLEGSGCHVGGTGKAVVKFFSPHEPAPGKTCANVAAGAHIFITEDDRDLDIVKGDTAFHGRVEGHLTVDVEEHGGGIERCVEGIVTIAATGAFLHIEQFQGKGHGLFAVQGKHDTRACVEAGLVEAMHVVALNLGEAQACGGVSDESLRLRSRNEGEQ